MADRISSPVEAEQQISQQDAIQTFANVLVEKSGILPIFPLISVHSNLEDIVGSNAVLYKRMRHLSGYFADSFQARAMAWHNKSRLQSFQFINSFRDYWLKEAA